MIKKKILESLFVYFIILFSNLNFKIIKYANDCNIILTVVIEYLHTCSYILHSLLFTALFRISRLVEYII